MCPLPWLRPPETSPGGTAGVEFDEPDTDTDPAADGLEPGSVEWEREWWAERQAHQPHPDGDLGTDETPEPDTEPGSELEAEPSA